MFDIVYNLILDAITMLGWLIPLALVISIIYKFIIKGVH